MTKTLIASAVAALALVAAGCGGSDEAPTASPTDEWADGFCTSITTWTDSLQSVKEQFTDLSSFSQDGLESAANDVKIATDELVTDLKGLGTPDTESGEAVKDSIDELSTTLDGEIATIEDTVQGVSGLTGVPSAVTSITSSLTAMLTALSSTLQAIDAADVDDELDAADVNDELRTAFQDSPACADISS